MEEHSLRTAATSGNAIDLTGQTVRFLMVDADGAEGIPNAAAEIDDATSKVHYDPTHVDVDRGRVLRVVRPRRWNEA